MAVDIELSIEMIEFVLKATSGKVLSLVLDRLPVSVAATNETVNQAAGWKPETGKRQTRFIPALQLVADRYDGRVHDVTHLPVVKVKHEETLAVSDLVS